MSKASRLPYAEGEAVLAVTVLAHLDEAVEPAAQPDQFRELLALR
ncbi:MAG TPA: hypothetical protein VN969_18115 [Streptosporangiaceae bacterium]|nr:hypothetical protein [Streptosporangiaceae bacterium]